MLEDSESDAELIQYALKRANVNFIAKVVETKKDFEKEILSFEPDIILSDHSLPQFSSMEALKLYRELGCTIPFILVTGTVSEEFAVHSIKEGADDYILKSNLTRLPASIQHALKTREVEKENIEMHKQLIKSENQVRRFATHLHHVLEDDRARIAREIHDQLGQQLAGIKMGISLFKKQKGLSPDIELKANEMVMDIDDTIQSLRKIATELRPGILDTLGLASSIEWLVKEFEKRMPIKCILEIDLPEQNIEKDISICFFRICQEALTNVMKHSGASQAKIILKQYADHLYLEVSDNGKGITYEKMENPFSVGLVGMNERANIIDAELSIKNACLPDRQGENSGVKVLLKKKINTIINQ